MQLAKRALCLSIGLSYTDSITVVSTATATTPQHLDFTASQTPEHRLLQLQLQAAELQKRMAIADALPQVAVGAFYGYGNVQASILRNGLGSEYGNGSLFFSVSVPLSAWWETAHKIKEHNLQIEQARLQQEHNNELLHMRAQQAHNQMNEAALLINEYENALQLAAQRYTLTKADYQAGRTTISQLLEAQTQLFQAQNNLTDAFISYRIAERKFLNYQH
jgi:outer membrane protein TolC